MVEDEEDTAFPLLRSLEREGYAVTWVETGQQALEHLAQHPAELMILDLGLPDIDGLEVCRQAREAGFDGGILIASARTLEADLVVALDHGADDYLAKPFGLAVLQARMRALLRRLKPVLVPTHESPAEVLRVDARARRVRAGSVEVALTVKEFDVLRTLADHRDSVVSREQLVAEVWSGGWSGSKKTLDVTIGRLRHKLEAAGLSARVVAVRGVGFRLDAALEV